MSNRTWLIMAAVAIAACGQSTDVDPARGAALAMPFKMALKRALLEGMEEGPDAGVDYCKIRAPDIAAQLSGEGVKVGRSSHRLRNPDNVAPGWAQPVLDQWSIDASNAAPLAMELPGDRVGYVEPIVVQPLCLNCHGTELSRDVTLRLAALYPDDQATGFNVGDFRGVLWVEYPADAAD
jgi:hypothetical protein